MGELLSQRPEKDIAIESGTHPINFIDAPVRESNTFNKKLGSIIGITDTDDLALLRRQLQSERKVPQLNGIELNLDTVNFLRNYYGFEPLDQEEYELLPIQSTGVKGGVERVRLEEEQQDETDSVENLKLTREDFGPIPSDPYVSNNQDLQALNSLFQSHPEVFPNNRFVNVRDWALWTDISVVPNKDINNTNSEWYIVQGNNNKVLATFPNEGTAELAFESIKEEDRKKAIHLITQARNFAIGETLDSPWEEVSNIEEKSLTKDKKIDEESELTQSEVEGIPNLAVLEQELEQLVTKEVQEEGGKLARIEGEISPGLEKLESVDKSAEIELLKQEAREAIQRYKEFGDRHAPNLRTESVQDTYRQLEKVAWDKVEELSHKLDGHLSRKLPQLRDILTAHKDLTNISDAKNFLVSTKTIKLNPEGNITHIVDNEGNEVELNRPRTFEEIFAKSRPVRIIYTGNNENKKLGYIIEGLNSNTPDWIAGVLSDKEFLEHIIVDPWDAPIEYILPNPEEEPPLSPIDKTPKLTPAEELSNVQVKENIGDTSDQVEGGEPTPQVSLDDLRLAYARAEEAWNRKRGDLNLKYTFELAREDYNTELDRVLKLKVAEGQEANIHQIFKDEVMSLRDSRIDQSQELQGKWEKRFNGAKEKFLGWATKNKTRWMLANIGLFAAGALLSSTGAGIPVSGALEMTRRSLGSVMSGVSSRNTLVGLMEDGEINRFGIKFKAVIPKLVEDSLKDDYINNASDDDLSTKLSTLEAYYRLNGGEFPKENQQQAYETILTELGQRVQEKTIENNQPQAAVRSKTSVQAESIQQIPKNKISSERYTSELLKTVAEKRVSELQKQQRNRTIANVVGTVAGGSLMSLLVADTMRPGGIFNPEQITNTPKPDIIDSPDNSFVQLQDISQLSKGETLWGEIAKQLGPNASPDQIQHALENYVQSGVGQNTMFQLAQGTEGGRGLLAQWGIDNANEMASLSKEQLYEVSRYLGPGQLEGISHFNIDHLEAFQPAEYVAPSPAEAPTIDSVYSETPASSPVGTESLGSEPTVPPAAEAPVATPSPEVPPIATTEFTRDLSEALGTTNLTETQLQEAIYSFATSEKSSVELYNQIISNEEGARFLSGFGVNSAADFANLRPNELYEIAQTMGVENLDQLPGFELNDIILAKFENAPDTLNLVKGAKPLSLIDNYIVQYTGDLPHSSSLGQEVLTTYLDTPEGKDWLYDAIVNNPEKLTGNQNIQFVEEYFRQKGIKSGADIDWTNLTQDKRFPTSIFWRETTLTGGRKIPPLSTLLKPGQMPGIKKALQLVLIKP